MRWMGVDGQARADHGHLLPLGGGLLDRGFHLGGWGGALGRMMEVRGRM